MTSKKVLIAEHCQQLNGVYKEGRFRQGPMMVIQHRHFEIVFDYHTVSTGQSSVTYTRVRTVFKYLEDYNLKVGKEGFLSKVGKAFGGQDIEIGDEIFDEQYIIKSNDELVTTRLLNEFDIKSRINFHKSFDFDIIKKNMMGIKCVEGEAGLYFSMIGKLKHTVEVINLIELFQHTLDQLIAMEIIEDVMPLTKMYKEKNIDDLEV